MSKRVETPPLPPETPPVAWLHRVGELPVKGLKVERIASPQECAAIADWLRIAGCDSLELRYSLRPRGEGRFAMLGRIEARITQTCVVTLEPVEARINEAIELELWPANELETVESDEGLTDPFGADDPEPIVAGLIDAGRIGLEHVAAAIDPFPRKDEADFDGTIEARPREAGAAEEANPFAALARLKGGKGSTEGGF